MTLLRAFTWYYRFVERRSVRFIHRFNRPNPRASGLVLVLYYIFVPMLSGWLVFAMLYESGLLGLLWDGYIPSFLSTEGETVFSHGFQTFGFGAIGLGLSYSFLGGLCRVPDAFRSPNYKNKRHLWKDWPDD
jgi:polyferredoxin